MKTNRELTLCSVTLLLIMKVEATQCTSLRSLGSFAWNSRKLRDENKQKTHIMYCDITTENGGHTVSISYVSNLIPMSLY